MNLQELNNTIHQASKSEFISKRATWVTTAKNLLNGASEGDIEYFENHTGRELFRKANLFGDNGFIQDSFDEGFRPSRFNPKSNSLSGNIISWYDAADPRSYELNSDGRILSANDKSGSYDLAPSKGIDRSPTIDKIKFDDGGFRNVFFYDRGVSHDNCTFRSYGFSHDFTSGELNILMVLHHMKSNLGDIDSQDFIFEAAQNGVHNSGTPRFFLRKGGESGANPAYSNAGLGNAFNFTETEAGKQFDNPVNLLLNFHIKNGKQISRLNGAEIKTTTRASVQNVTNEETGNGGIFWGSNIHGGQTLEGGFGEIILYDDFAQDGEFLESYLAKKWGFDIPTIKHFKTFV